MNRHNSKLRIMAALIRAGDYREVLPHLQRWVYSDSVSYGLYRDLTQPFSAPSAKIPLTVRPLQETDVPWLLGIHPPHTRGKGIYDRLSRMEFIATKIPTGYVAVAADGSPCYMQFLIGPQENAAIRNYFGGLFPLLGSDEALLEHAFTLESFQGLGVMASAMAQIAEKALGLGARRVITFVSSDNIPALKGCQRAGFSPYMVRRERWSLFRRQLAFRELPPGIPYPFETSQTRKPMARLPLG